MKKLLLLLVVSIAMIQLVSAQVIEVVGMGVLNTTNPTLTIPDMKTVDKVVVEAAAIFKYGTSIPTPPKQITFSSNKSYPVSYINVEEIKAPGVTTKTNGSFIYHRIFGQNYSNGYYTATFEKKDIKGDGKISLNKNGLGKNILTFFAYVYRTNGAISKFSILYNPLNRAFVYLNGDKDPLVRNFVMTAGTGPRNIEVAVPLSDGDDADERVGVITLWSGSQKTNAKEFKLNGLGKNFHVEKVMLYNVPKDVTDVKIEIYSPTAPIKKGDSFIVGLPVLTVQEEEDCAICKGGITALELKYTGSVVKSTIIVYKGKVDNKNKLATFTDVSPNQSIKFSGNVKDKTMGSNIIITINGIKNTEIHTSCSQDIYAGMQFGDFLIESGTSKYGGPLCFYEKPPCRECKGGVTMLELKYNGLNTATNISIYKGKVDTKNLLNEFKNVPAGGTIKFIGNEKNQTMGTNIIITIDGKKHTEIHTSCSKPIYPGMQFGDFEIVSGTSKDGGPLCPGDNGDCGECKGGVTELLLQYTGTVSTVSVKNKNGVINATNDATNKTILISNNGYKLGTNIYITVGKTTTTLHTSCSQPIYPGLKFGIFEILSGTSKDGGLLCEKPGDNGACECEGGVTSLKLEYLGFPTVDELTVKTNKGTKFVHKVDGTFYIYDDGTKLGTNIYITVGTTTTTLHTSCSQPIYAGMTFGVGNVFKIVDGTSLSGGKLCDVPYIKKKSAMIENIETIAEIHEFSVYPNPVLNNVTVSFMPAYDGLATVELYNSLGQKADILFNQSVNKEVPVSFTFSGHKFKEGLYLLILQNGDYMETAKVRIAR